MRQRRGEAERGRGIEDRHTHREMRRQRERGSNREETDRDSYWKTDREESLRE